MSQARFADLLHHSMHIPCAEASEAAALQERGGWEERARNWEAVVKDEGIACLGV